MTFEEAELEPVEMLVLLDARRRARERAAARARTQEEEVRPVVVNGRRYEPPPAVDVSRLAVLGAKVLPAVFDQELCSWRIRVVLDVLDRADGKSRQVAGDTLISLEAVDGYPAAYAVAVRAAVLRALEHEVDETLRVAGVRWQDPHEKDEGSPF